MRSHKGRIKMAIKIVIALWREALRKL